MSIRSFYWDKQKKKTVYKQVSISKFNNESEAREFLNNWKKEQNEKQNIKDPIIENASTIKDLIIEDIPTINQKDPIIEDVLTIDNTINQINYTPFKLKIDNMDDTGSSTVIFGASKSGKTYLLKNILNDIYSDDDLIVILFADNIHSAIYSDLNKNIIKSDKFDPDLIKKIHKIQKKTKNKYKFVIVLDDMILEKSDPQLLKLFLTYRNSKISTLILLQSPTLLCKNSRFNGNNFIFKKCNNSEYVEQVLKFFIGGYDKFHGLSQNEKIKLFQDITNNYGFVYMDALNDKISYHK